LQTAFSCDHSFFILVGGKEGSSFYEGYYQMYLVPLIGDKVYVAQPDYAFDHLHVADYNSGEDLVINLPRNYSYGEVAEISEYLVNFSNDLIRLEMWQGELGLPNYFHMAKVTQNGGIVEGGYANEHSSFGYCDNDMYTLFRDGERILVAPTTFIDRIEIYDFNESKYYNYSLNGDIYPKGSLIDITPYISQHKNKFIEISVYNFYGLQICFHMIKLSSKIEPVLSLSPGWNLFSPMFEPTDGDTSRNISLKKENLIVQKNH